MHIVVAGSRGWMDTDLLYSTLDAFIEPLLEMHSPSSALQDGPITIISGTAHGADTMGERWAESRDIPILRMPADWETHGRRAGYLRNEQMAAIADHVFVFWDGVSRGSQHMIDIATRMDIPVDVITQTSFGLRVSQD